MKFLTLIAALLALPALTACNTTEGIGEDITAAGQGIDNAASSEKPYYDERDRD